MILPSMCILCYVYLSLFVQAPGTYLRSFSLLILKFLYSFIDFLMFSDGAPVLLVLWVGAVRSGSWTGILLIANYVCYLHMYML